MSTKSNAFSILENLIKLLQKQFNTSVKIVRSDNGIEFFDANAVQFYNNMGIVHQTSLVGTPQQNGRVERKHKHLLEVARALYFQSKIPLKYWVECLLHATFLINRLPLSVLH